MIYPDTIEHKIGFVAVREQVAELCTSEHGRKACGLMSFSNVRQEVVTRLEETAEMLCILGSEIEFPIGNIHDMNSVLASIRVEGVHVSAQDFLRLRVSMETMSGIAGFFKTSCDNEGKSPYPRLNEIALRLITFPNLIREIDRVIDRWGNIKDNASPQLTAIRTSLASMSGSVNSLIRRVMSRAVKDGLIEADTTPSVRDGRLVIPVSPMNKRKIPGIVHDESASGKTIFIEPSEVVEANNRIRELELDERREIMRILVDLTDRIRPHIEDIDKSFTTLGVFDFIHAKARFAITNGAAMPRIGKDCMTDWHDAFHPVLRQSLARQNKELVKLDLRLDKENRIVIISGPNAGGKSVALKTVGIVQYMAQCGLLPTMASHSTLGIFEDIFIDIGDDQSIEDDLSTYSSHLRHMKTILSRGGRKSMLLIDEFGAGTEPQIGGAIAQSLLKRFNDKGMWGIVTTHFQNLKLMAEDTPGLINGSMLYDRHLMRPLFKLSIGNPGSSFAIEIARKTGLPEDIIADAEQLIGSDYINADKYLLDINRDKRYWENKRASVKTKEKKLDELLARYEAEAATLRERRKEIIDEARKEAIRIIEGSNAAIERTIHDIRRAQADKEKTSEARKALADKRRQLGDDNNHRDTNALLDKVERRSKKKHSVANKPTENPTEETRPIRVGDNVLLDGSGTVGTVTEISGKNATVIFGNLTTTTKIDRLTRTIKKANSGAGKAASFVSVATREDMRERQLNFRQDIDIRGMRVDEALQTVTYFIDDAVQFNGSRVRILHGTGTGALRQAVREYLESVRAVRSYHDEDVRFGGAGITVVEF
ncbi:MAG: Smr/MutS family protein [Muribaculaceae bacterium]|nr:Smr/MutS family protein [Muribaculaceae bacterium]